jgi:hypothetical protein
MSIAEKTPIAGLQFHIRIASISRISLTYRQYKFVVLHTKKSHTKIPCCITYCFLRPKKPAQPLLSYLRINLTEEEHMVRNTQDSPIPVTKRIERQTFKTMPLSSGKHRIEFHGNLPLGWAGSLAQGLANRSINILSGYARRISMSQWIRRDNG